MAISPLLTLASTALAPVARDVAAQIVDGFSFQQLFGSRVAGTADASVEGHGHAPFASSPAAMQLAAIRRDPQGELEKLVERLRERLTAGGFDLAPGVQLSLGRRGQIQVDGDHPDRAAMEHLLGSDAQLTAGLQRLAQVLAGASATDPRDFRLNLNDTESAISLAPGADA